MTVLSAIKPKPDFKLLEKILRGHQNPDRIHFLELDVDAEVMGTIVQEYLNEKWIPCYECTHAPSYIYSKEQHITYQKQRINFFHKMGYDSLTVWSEYRNMHSREFISTTDTAVLSRGERRWAEEKKGIIESWEDFEKIDWDNLQPVMEILDFAQEILPDGMMLTPHISLYEVVSMSFLGPENMFMLSHDQPDLVEAVFEAWGKVVYRYCKEMVRYPKVGAVFAGDDLGHKTGTMMSPDFLRKNVFPWFKKYAELTHQQGKMYWYHCCGNPESIMDDLIDYVHIDALHAFEDVCCPVIEYKKKYGDKIALLGGVDVDKLARLDKENLRNYIRTILHECGSGKYALGSGNTISNYVPIENYLTMIEEGTNWRV